MARRKKRIDWARIRWGTLTEWCKRHEAEIRRLTGKSCFTRTGELNDRTLRYLYKHPDIIKKISKTHWRRIWRKLHFKLYVLRS